MDSPTAPYCDGRTNTTIPIIILIYIHIILIIIVSFMRDCEKGEGFTVSQ